MKKESGARSQNESIVQLAFLLLVQSCVRKWSDKNLINTLLKLHLNMCADLLSSVFFHCIRLTNNLRSGQRLDSSAES